MEHAAEALAKLAHPIAGFLGGLTAWLLDRDMHWRDGMALVVIGAISSYYLIPALLEHTNLSAGSTSFIAYMTGISARAIIIYARDKFTNRAKVQIDRVI
jgi:hypothetical protein